MKKLYEFTLTQKVEKEYEEKDKDSEGNEVTIKKTKEEKVSRNFFLKKPTRSMFDEAELYFGVKLSEGIKAGMLTRAMLAKRFDNDGGVLSDADKEQYSGLYFTLFEVQNQITRLQLTPEAERTDQEKEEYNEAVRAMIGLKAQIQEFETAQASFFDQTAENRARNKTITWWVLHLAHETKENGDEIPFFGNGNVDDRLSVYDGFEEEGEEFNDSVIKNFSYYTSFWYVGRAKTQEDFEQLSTMEETTEEILQDQDGSVSPSDVENAFREVLLDEEEEEKEEPVAETEEAPEVVEEESDESETEKDN